MLRAIIGRASVEARTTGLYCVLALTGAILAAAGPAAAADPLPPRLFSASASGDALATGDPTVLRGRGVTFDLAMLQTAAANQRVRLNLFDDAAHVVRFGSVAAMGPATTAFRGQIEGHPGASVNFVLQGNFLAGVVRVPGEGTYRVRTVAGGVTQVTEVDESQFPACGPAPVEPEGLGDAGGDAGPLGDPGDCDTGAIIDVLVLYTPNARSAAGGAVALEAEAALAVAAANDAYTNSNVSTQLRLVHTAETSYGETGTYNDHLSWLRGTSDGIMDEVHQLRDDYEADLVALLVDDRDYCGLAYLMVSPGPGFESLGFSVTTWVCAVGNLSFAHEIGHNMGCCHDHGNCSGGAHPYSWGHRFTGDSSTQWRTVMSYSPGSRIPYFSNPDVDYDGQPTGIADGNPSPADNARTIDETAAIVASFRCSTQGGVYVGPPGGRWHDAVNWGAGVVPDASTNVTVPTLVIVDTPGAVAASVSITSGGSLFLDDGATLAAPTVTVASSTSLLIDDATVTATDVDVLTGGVISTFDPANSLLTATSVDVSAGGLLGGVGTVDADVVSDGEVRPGMSVGTLTIGGDFTQTANGLLSSEVESLAAPDLLDVSGTATLDGVLRVRVATGPAPAPPECFTLLDAASVVGEFASTDLDFLTSSTEFDVTYDATTVETCVQALSFPLVLGGAAGDRAGFSVANAGDIDHDGYDDAVVGVPFADAGGASSGQVLVYSGRTGAILYTKNGRAGARLGWSVAGAGDVNKDGYPDFIAGAPYDRDEKGRARVFSGKDGSVLHTKKGRRKGDRFGWSVAGGADANDDRRDDFIIGAPYDATNGKKAGAAYLYSGKSGDELERYFGEAKADQFGSSVAMLAKADGDSYGDFAVGAPRNDDGGSNAGKVYVYSGKNGSLLYDLSGKRKGDKFGTALAAAGRVDSDNRDDLAVGSPNYDAGGSNSVGRVDVYSGRDGDRIWAKNGNGAGDRTGWAVGAAGDVDGDGRDDVVIGSPRHDTGGSNAGRMDVRSGRNGAVLFSRDGAAAGDELGYAVAGLGDLDDDGFSDVIAAAPKNDLSGANAGQIYFYFSGGPPSPDAGFDLALSGGASFGGRATRAGYDRGLAALNAARLLAVVAGWGACPAGDCPGDLNGDGMVDAADLFAALDGAAGEPVVADAEGEAQDDASARGVIIAPAEHGGVLVVPGDFAPAPTDTLLLEIAGALGGDEHDLVVVEGAARLDGRLFIAVAPGFAPRAGEEYSVLVAETLDGVFAEVVAPTPAWDVRYGGDVVTLRAGGDAVAADADSGPDPGLDLTGDGWLDVDDVLMLLDAWGRPGPADLDGDGSVDALDLTLLLSALR